MNAYDDWIKQNDQSNLLGVMRQLFTSPFGGGGDSSVIGRQQGHNDSSNLLDRLINGTLDDTRSNYYKALEDLNRQYKQAEEQGATGVSALLPTPLSQPMSVADQLQQQLNGIQVHTTPLADLQKQANATVSAQYDPQINELLRDMGSTKNRAASNEGKTREMYNALAQDANSQIPAIQQMMQSQQADTSNRYAGAQADLQAQYDQQKNNQQSILQQLGIQAAAPDATNQMATDQAYFQQQNKLSSNQALDQLASQGSADQAFMRDTATTDRLAGVNASNDIASQLENYLQDAQGKVEDLKGSKANSMASLVQQLQAADAQNAQSQYNNQFNQMMQLNQFQRQLENDANQSQMDQLNLLLKQQQQANQGQGNPLFKGTTGMSGMSNFLSSQYPNNPQEATALSNLVASVLSNSDVQMGQRMNGINRAPITDEYLIQLLRNGAQQQGITNPTDINNAIDALLAYQGKLR